MNRKPPRRQRQRALDSHEPVRAYPLEVTAQSCGDSTEKMIRRFTKAVRNDGILYEVYSRSYFLKPSEKKRKKRARAQRAFA